MLARIVLAVAVVVTAGAGNATPTLIGEATTLEVRNFSSTGEFLGSTFDSATVGGGVEFTSGVEPEILDIGAASISIRQLGGGGWVSFFPDEFDEHILTFSGSVTIENAVLEPDHGVLNLTQDNVSFGDHHVSIVYAGTTWDGPEVVSISLTLAPEPSTILLLVSCGLAVAVWQRRRAT